MGCLSLEAMPTSCNRWMNCWRHLLGNNVWSYLDQNTHRVTGLLNREFYKLLSGKVFTGRERQWGKGNSACLIKYYSAEFLRSSVPMRRAIVNLRTSPRYFGSTPCSSFISYPSVLPEAAFFFKGKFLFFENHRRFHVIFLNYCKSYIKSFFLTKTNVARIGKQWNHILTESWFLVHSSQYPPSSWMRCSHLDLGHLWYLFSPNYSLDYTIWSFSDDRYLWSDMNSCCRSVSSD